MVTRREETNYQNRDNFVRGNHFLGDLTLKFGIDLARDSSLRRRELRRIRNGFRSVANNYLTTREYEYSSAAHLRNSVCLSKVRYNNRIPKCSEHLPLLSPSFRLRLFEVSQSRLLMNNDRATARSYRGARLTISSKRFSQRKASARGLTKKTRTIARAWGSTAVQTLVKKSE